MSVETDVDLRTTIFIVACRSVSYLIAGNDHAALQRHRRTPRLAELEVLRGGTRRFQVSRQTEFEAGRFPQDTLRFCGVLHTWQFNHNTVGTLTLQDRKSVV